MTNAERQLITSTEAAKRLACSVYTVARLAREGKLPYVQKLAAGKGGAYLFDPQIVDEYARIRLDDARQVVDALQQGQS